MLCKVHAEAFATHLVRASNSSWARRYSTSKLDEFRKFHQSHPLCNRHTVGEMGLAVSAVPKRCFFSEKLRPNWDKPRGKNIRLYMNCVREYSELMFLVKFSIFSSILGAQEVKKQLSNGNYSFWGHPPHQNRAKNRKNDQKHQFWIFPHTIHI